MTASPFQIPRRWEWLALIAIVLVAIVFRFEQFDQVPPGLHYDEAIDAHIAQEIRAGNWSIYYEEGWGRESLYHTFVAFTENFIGDPTSALRFTSALLGLIQLLAAYALFKKMFDVPTALIGAAWIAVMFWTVSASRAGLRNIALTTFATLTALAFWNVFKKWQAQITRRVSRITNHLPIIITAILLGLTLYTYQPGRVVPLIFLVFIGYLLLRRQIDLKTYWRLVAVFFGLALIIAVPLIVFLAQHPDAETGRAFQTEPIRALLRGDLSPVFGLSGTAIATLKMFTFDGGGDPQPLYNISGRPLFIGLGSILFYIGLIVCVIRWKQPAYAFILIWLIVTLLPNMVTAPAPFFYRAIAAQTPTMALPAIATVAIGKLFNREGAKTPRKDFWNLFASLRLPMSAQRWAAGVGGLILAFISLVSLGQTAIATQHDYFDVWGQDGDVRFQYSAAHTEIAHALDASSDSSPVIISGYFTEDADPYIFGQTLRRSDLQIGWFDAREALVALNGASSERVATPSFTPLNADLKSKFLNNTQPLTATKDFKIYPLAANALRTSIESWATADALQLPISFDSNINLIGYQATLTASVGSTLPIFTAWRVTSEWQPSSTAIFIHLLKPDGSIAAQDDRLGYPRHNWHSGDEFVQVHHLALGNLPPGEYSIELGIYSRDTNVRWAARDQSGQSIGDHILIGSIEIVP